MGVVMVMRVHVMGVVIGDCACSEGFRWARALVLWVL